MHAHCMHHIKTRDFIYFLQGYVHMYVYIKLLARRLVTIILRNIFVDYSKLSKKVSNLESYQNILDDSYILLMNRANFT